MVGFLATKPEAVVCQVLDTKGLKERPVCCMLKNSQERVGVFSSSWTPGPLSSQERVGSILISNLASKAAVS